MSPEQCTGSKIDQRSDIYSLGCVMYESLTGSTPFVGQNCAGHNDAAPHSPNCPTLKEASLGNEFPVGLENIINKMLAKNPASRYPSCLAVAEDLMRFQKDPQNSVAEEVGSSECQIVKIEFQHLIDRPVLAAPYLVRSATFCILAISAESRISKC